MANVGNNMQVMHAFAHDANEYFRNSSGSVYREGNVIFSYGAHFPMARNLPDCFLVTTDTASVTTAKQMCYLWRAIHGVKPMFYVPEVHADTIEAHVYNFADYRERVESALLDSVRARKNKDMHLERAQRIAIEANQYAACFNVNDSINLDHIDMADVAATVAKLAAEKKARAKIERERVAKENAEKIEAWREGASVNLPHSIAPMLRISSDGERIETSWHANFPVSHAPIVWAVIKRCKRNAKRWVANGEQIKLGYYTVNWIDASGNVKAGCHNVSFTECERLAVALGLEKIEGKTK